MKTTKTIIRSIVTTTIATGLAMYVNAQNLNGTLNSGFYGSPLAVQTINTGFGNAGGGNDSVGGSELDAAYGQISGGDLYLFLAGNFENNGNHLNVFVSGGAPGQSTLNAPATATLQTMNGSVFSPGFQATWAFDMNDYQGTLYNEEYTYAGPGALAGGYVGAVGETSTGIGAGLPGGGGYPAYTYLALNNNHASMMGASGAAANYAAMLSTTTGLELQIPLSVLGWTGGNIEVLADINGGGDSYLSNQFLPGLPVGSGNLGTPGFNFANTPDEYFTVSVPEPSTLAVFGLSGLMASRLIRRRK
jgi:hypothetical protein